MILRSGFSAAVFLLAFVVTAPAAPVFDVTSIATGAGGTASGTSNGVNFTLSPTFISGGLTVTDGTYTGFSNPTFHNPPLATSDVLHIGGQDFVLTFGQTISSALIYFTDNPSTPDSELDFGIAPTVLSGDVFVIGTRFGPSTIDGGLVRLDNINSTTLTHIASVAGGLNFAIVVTPSVVPEPSSVITLATGSLGILAFRLRCRRKRLA